MQTEPDFFTDQFLDTLPGDTLEALNALAEEFWRFGRHYPFQTATNSRNLQINATKYTEALAIILAFCEARSVPCPINKVALAESDAPGQCKFVFDYLGKRHQEWQAALRTRNTSNLLQEAHQTYLDKFNKVAAYKFSEADLKKIQDLINELRDTITNSLLLTNEHRQRLLRRLEATQRELQRNATEIHQIFGLLGEAGIVARKFGEDIKPITERARELAKIVLAVIMVKEGIHQLPQTIQHLLDE